MYLFCVGSIDLYRWTFHLVLFSWVLEVAKDVQKLVVKISWEKQFLDETRKYVNF